MYAKIAAKYADAAMRLIGKAGPQPGMSVDARAMPTLH
jgi:hypothetical protein